MDTIASLFLCNKNFFHKYMICIHHFNCVISESTSESASFPQALTKMKSDWEAIHFNFVPYKDTGISILSAIDDIQVLLDDHIVKTTTMKNSPFIKPFENDINDWDHTLVRASNSEF